MCCHLLTCAAICWCMLPSVYMCCHLLICASICLYVLPSVYLCCHLLLCAVMCWCVLSSVDMCCHLLMYSAICLYVLPSIDKRCHLSKVGGVSRHHYCAAHQATWCTNDVDWLAGTSKTDISTIFKQKYHPPPCINHTPGQLHTLRPVIYFLAKCHSCFFW